MLCTLTAFLRASLYVNKAFMHALFKSENLGQQNRRKAATHQHLLVTCENQHVLLQDFYFVGGAWLRAAGNVAGRVTEAYCSVTVSQSG